METTYSIVGSDGQQYGPITLSQIKTWIGEGRIGAETQVWRSDSNSWLPASQYVELGLGQPASPPRPPTPGVIQAPAVSNVDPMLVRRARSGARWFFWIAGLSVINAFTASSGTGVVFVVCLAITQFISGSAARMDSGGQGVGMVLVFLVAGLFALLGYFAWKRHTWSFIAGMVFYAADALLAVLFQAWMLVAFHAFVLFWLFLGLKATLELKSRSQTGAA
jgi:GYF domain 2